jgi:diguanylate cyclase (GGDEF)-like protein
VIGRRHGGVYVPVSETSLPNPYLEFLPERDIETTDGRRLTLINPWYMTRLAFDLDNRHDEAISKVTSLKSLNSGNAPDPWERSALQQLEQGKEMVCEVSDIEGRPYVRSMRPFYVETTCLKCHADQGYQTGDVRGGISISIPFEPIFSENWQHKLLSVGFFCLLWFVGLIGVVLLGRKLYSQTCNVIASERQRDRAEVSLNYLSNYDRLTNLPNRFKFEEQLHDLFQRVDSADDTIAVIALEIRNYGQISDNFDHPVGDALFKLHAERMAVLLTEKNSIARYGEDRLLLSSPCRDDHPCSEDLLQKILAVTSKPLILEKHEFFPVVCIGVAFYPTDAMDARRLVQKAVSALTFCLEKKQSDVTLYSESLQAEAKNRLEIESGLRLALLAKNGFKLFLQPQIDSISGALVGAEALIRLPLTGRGYVPPDEFIPIAEENGLILQLGEWVLQTACIQAVKLRQYFNRIIRVGVNVSAKQFQDPAFVDILDEVLAIDGMLPEMLEIEITEGTFIENIDRPIEILTDLKVRGLQITIDDFGTGYCSLNYLKKFPIDRLKIDRSFVADIASNEDDRILINLIVDMGNKLGLDVIAEGVEDDVQKHLLIGMGCHAMQGFLFGRPVPFEDFCALIEEMQKS